MRNVLLLALMAFIMPNIFGQSNSVQTNEKNLYSIALKSSILQMEKDWSHIDDSVAGEDIRTDYRHMIVQKDPLITKGLPTDFDNHSVEFLDDRGLLERYRKLGKSYAILVIRPMQNDGPTLTIAVVAYWVSSKKGSLQLALSDWSDVGFEYDCDKREFVVSSVKLGGI